MNLDKMYKEMDTDEMDKMGEALDSLPDYNGEELKSPTKDIDYDTIEKKNGIKIKFI